MCDDCGCRTQPPIAQLGEEHDRIGSVTGDLRAAHARGDRRGAATTARALLALFDPHIVRGEGALFPELAVAGTSHHVRCLEDEHEQRPGVAPDRQWRGVGE